MKVLFTLGFLLGLLNTVYGQLDHLKQSDIDSLYIRTINNQGYLFLSSGPKYFQITENTGRIKNHKDFAYFHFLTDEELIKIALKKTRPLTVHRVGHKIISKDTIDVNIGIVSVTAKRSLHFNNGLKTKKANFALSCGGTNGYQPTARYAYDSDLKAWIEIEYIIPKTFRDTLKENGQR